MKEEREITKVSKGPDGSIAEVEGTVEDSSKEEDDFLDRIGKKKYR